MNTIAAITLALNAIQELSRLVNYLLEAAKAKGEVTDEEYTRLRQEHAALFTAPHWLVEQDPD
jgi:uncharacterized protein YdgA (DUF945 family)